LSLQEAVASARVDLANAQDALDKARNPYTASQIAEANAAVQQAQQQLADAQALGPLDVADAQYAATQAENAYSDSIVSFANNRITVDVLDQAERDWERAELNVQTVQTNADKAVVDAQNNLATAQSALGNMTADPLDVALKQVQVASAQSALDQVVARLGNTTLVAPFDGIVAAANVQAGQSVNAGTVAVQIADPSGIEVSTTVDEIDVPQVKQGQKATISLDALPNDEFSGIVSSISSFGNVQSGVVSYPVTINLTVPSGVQLRQGMSATATIITQEVDNVLLVPAAAISGGSTNPRVRVMVNGVPELRAVTVGQSNDQYTQIVSGLNAGDEVVVTSTTTSTSSSTSGRGIGIGGFGGGGIINIGR
jgi:RND family efflux transporter MFP subunit